MDDSYSIVAYKLVVSKRHQTILDVDGLKIRPGVITGLIGPSGSGKTTLMRAIVGVQSVTGGELMVLSKSAGYESLRRQIGYMPQIPAVYEDLTVLQNLQYFASIAEAGAGAADDMIEQVQLSGQRTQLVESLSGGQRARVSLAVALLGEPDLLILDEPTVGLDPLLRRQLWRVFSELAAHGKTVLVSSHVMDEAERCSELVLMRGGKIIWNDSRQKILQKTGAQSVEAAMVAMVEGMTS